MTSGLSQSVQTRLVRHAEDAYGGQRVTLVAFRGAARLRVQVDVGIGDAVTSAPEWLDYPGLLDLPQARLRAYQRETAIAEKVHAMVTLGRNNSRMKDFFDLHALASRQSFEGQLLADALRATFGRRVTDIPQQRPLALSPDFAEVEGKRAQWGGFVRRSRFIEPPPTLDDVIQLVSQFAWPALGAAASEHPWKHRWPAGGPWIERTA